MYDKEKPVKPKSIEGGWNHLKEELAKPIVSLETVVEEENVAAVEALLYSYKLRWEEIRPGSATDKRSGEIHLYRIIKILFPAGSVRIPGLHTGYSYPFVVRIPNTQDLYFQDHYTVSDMANKTTVMYLPKTSPDQASGES